MGKEKTVFYRTALVLAYNDHVMRRSGLPYFGEVHKFAQKVADRISDVRLCRLFVEAQFETLGEGWCRKTFKRAYPPPSVVFGNGSWDRYQEYIETV